MKGCFCIIIHNIISYRLIVDEIYQTLSISNRVVRNCAVVLTTHVTIFYGYSIAHGDYSLLDRAIGNVDGVKLDLEHSCMVTVPVGDPVQGDAN